MLGVIHHIPSGSVGTTEVTIKIGGTARPSLVSRKLVIVNSHGTQTLSISFDGANWIILAAVGGRFEEEVSCSEFLLKGSGAGTTYWGYALV